VCERCQDLGWLAADVPYGHPDWGQAIECPCGLVARKRSARLDGAFGYSAKLAGYGPGDLRPIKGAGPMIAAVKAFIARPAGWLYLHGPRGTGKTMAASVIVNALRAKGIEAVFVVVPELLGWLKDAFDPTNGRDYDSDWEYIKGVPVLVLDDLGTEAPTAWVEERLYELCNWRYRLELPTVWTSNLCPDGLRDGRLASRLSDVTLCRVVPSGSLDVRRIPR